MTDPHIARLHREIARLQAESVAEIAELRRALDKERQRADGALGNLPADLAAIEARLAAATQGPWYAFAYAGAWRVMPAYESSLEICDTGSLTNNAEEDAAFIAAAPSDIRALLTIARLAAAAVQAWRDAEDTTGIEGAMLALARGVEK
jgi:hypothetical protein